MALRNQSGNLINRGNIAAPVASTGLFLPDSERSGLQVSADKDLTYVLLYSGKDGVDGSAGAVASATAFDIVIPAGGSWPGTIGGVVWTGGASVITATQTGRVSWQST